MAMMRPEVCAETVAWLIASTVPSSRRSVGSGSADTVLVANSPAGAARGAEAAVVPAWAIDMDRPSAARVASEICQVQRLRVAIDSCRLSFSGQSGRPRR